jgi:hypothetical protein
MFSRIKVSRRTAATLGALAALAQAAAADTATRTLYQENLDLACNYTSQCLGDFPSDK